MYVFCFYFGKINMDSLKDFFLSKKFHKNSWEREIERETKKNLHFNDGKIIDFIARSEINERIFNTWTDRIPCAFEISPQNYYHIALSCINTFTKWSTLKSNKLTIEKTIERKAWYKNPIMKHWTKMSRLMQGTLFLFLFFVFFFCWRWFIFFLLSR